jgi:hypothetical protein
MQIRTKLGLVVRRLSAWAWGWEIARSKDAEMLAKCHTDNCRSISQLAHELGQARDAERLVRMQLANSRETLQRLSSPNIQRSETGEARSL